MAVLPWTDWVTDMMRGCEKVEETIAGMGLDPDLLKTTGKALLPSETEPCSLLPRGGWETRPKRGYGKLSERGGIALQYFTRITGKS
jgi:hypothetical protein